MQIIIEEKIPVYLSNDEAMLFTAFQKNYHIIARVIGCMDSLRLSSLDSSTMSMDFDAEGVITHTAITKHYRK